MKLAPGDDAGRVYRGDVSGPEKKRRAALALVLCMTAAGSLPLAAQESTVPSVLLVTPQISASYFPSYVSEDAWTRRRGIDVGARIGPGSGLGVKVGYTYVPQATTTSSSAPRLHAVRVLLSGAARLEPHSRLTLWGGVGAARVTVEAQGIDCGDFPLCAEWAPRSGNWILPAVEVGAGVRVWRRIGWLVEAGVLIPRGEAWSAEGDPGALVRLGTGVAIRLGTLSP